MQGYDNKLKHFVAGQLPEFVSENHPLFVAFMEAYFEWLQTQQCDRRISPLSLLDQRNIDESLDAFIALFKTEYLKNFPAQLAFDQSTGSVLDERKLMKHIRSFYKAKGTEKAYKFLFLVLYNTYAEIYSPKVDILRLSDGKWNVLHKMKTTSFNGNRLFAYNGGTLSQRSGNGVLTAYTTIKNIIQYSQGGYQVTEFVITPPFGTFEANTPVQISAPGTSAISERIYTVLTGFELCSTGETEDPTQNKWRLYKVGDKIVLYPKRKYGYSEGYGAIGQVSEIDYLQSPFFLKTGQSDARGPVKKFRVVDGGVNYSASDWDARIESVDGIGATVIPKFGAVIADYGFYSNDDGQASSKKKLQDNRVYQDFSYAIKTDESYDRWIETIKKLIHPAGVAVFAQQYLYRASGYRVDDKNSVRSYEDPVIGHYTPYRFKTYENLRNNSAGVDLYPAGYNPANGTVDENGTQAHNPGTGALSQDLIQGINNVFCLNADHQQGDYVQVFTVNPVTGGYTGTEELQAKHETWNGCTGTDGAGCCLSQPYWIVYSHPNSRGYSHIPQYTCETVNGVQTAKLNRFSCIRLDDFFHMEDPRFAHAFTPGTSKFSGYEVDDFVVVDESYVSGIPNFRSIGSVPSLPPGTELNRAFNPFRQGQNPPKIIIPGRPLRLETEQDDPGSV